MESTELFGLGQQIFECRKEIDALKLKLEEPQKRLGKLQAKMIATLEELEQSKLPVKGFGTISMVTKWSVKVPKGEDKDAFFDSLPEADYKALRTVNSAQLNSWYKEKMAAAIEAGQDFDVEGIEEPKDYKTLSIRKG